MLTLGQCTIFSLLLAALILYLEQAWQRTKSNICEKGLQWFAAIPAFMKKIHEKVGPYYVSHTCNSHTSYSGVCIDGRF